mgnify:CR=1 FL=1
MFRTISRIRHIQSLLSPKSLVYTTLTNHIPGYDTHPSLLSPSNSFFESPKLHSFLSTLSFPFHFRVLRFFSDAIKMESLLKTMSLLAALPSSSWFSRGFGLNPFCNGSLKRLWTSRIRWKNREMVTTTPSFRRKSCPLMLWCRIRLTDHLVLVSFPDLFTSIPLWNTAVKWWTFW